MYKAHLYTFTHRRNTVNGRLYKDDPTIFYWDLINEPRWCASACCTKPLHLPPLSADSCQQTRVSPGLQWRAGSGASAALSSGQSSDLLHALCSTGCGFALQQWVEEMSVYMKSIDPNHLVTIGEEGFYSTTCDRCARSSKEAPTLHIPAFARRAASPSAGMPP